MIGFETAGNDLVYDWRVEHDAPLQREQVFPQRTFEEIPAPEIHARVTAALDRLAPDGVGIMSYGYPDARAALAWCRRHRKVAVNLWATNEHDTERTAWRERIKRIIVSLYDAALAGGTSHAAYLAKLGFNPDRIFYTQNVIDNAYFRREAEAARQAPDAYRHLPGLDEATPFFLASNRFTPIKNLDRLLQAYAYYRQRAEHPWRLLLLGDGPERPRLEAQIRNDWIDGVVLCGFRQIEELPPYYGRAGAFVHPTLKDTWGLVVNEAMAAGLPVLVSDRAGCTPDLVAEGKTGYSFDPLDVDQLTALMTHVAAPDTNRETMGAQGRHLIEERFSLDVFARGLWDAFEAGRAGADRPFSLEGRLVLGAVRLGARSVRSFHTADL